MMRKKTKSDKFLELDTRIKNLEYMMKMHEQDKFYNLEVPMRDVVYAIIKHLGMSIKVYLESNKEDKE